MKALNQHEHVFKVFLRYSGIERHFLRRGLQKTVVVDITNDQLGRFAIVGVERVLVQLPHQMLLQRLLSRDGIEKELALFLRFLRAAAVTTRLRHVVAPFLIKLRQLIEFLFEIVVRRSCFRFGRRVRIRRVRQFFQHRIRFHFLLHQIAQLKKRRLEDEQTLLELRGEDLLQR